jgi:hypothetical protein
MLNAEAYGGAAVGRVNTPVDTKADHQTTDDDEDEYLPVKVVRISDVLALAAPIARAQFTAVAFEADEE